MTTANVPVYHLNDVERFFGRHPADDQDEVLDQVRARTKFRGHIKATDLKDLLGDDRWSVFSAEVPSTKELPMDDIGQPFDSAETEDSFMGDPETEAVEARAELDRLAEFPVDTPLDDLGAEANLKARLSKGLTRTELAELEALLAADVQG